MSHGGREMQSKSSYRKEEGAKGTHRIQSGSESATVMVRQKSSEAHTVLKSRPRGAQTISSGMSSLEIKRSGRLISLT